MATLDRLFICYIFGRRTLAPFWPVVDGLKGGGACPQVPNGKYAVLASIVVRSIVGVVVDLS